MNDKLTLREKLSKIQNELKVPKNQRNSFGNYNYRSCEDILEALKPLLLEYKCILVIGDTIEQIGERYYVKAQATIKDVEGEAEIFINAYAREEETKKGMDGSQITGASSSYARKYALNGLFGIDDTKDSDTTNTESKTITAAIKKPEIAKTPDHPDNEFNKSVCQHCGGRIAISSSGKPYCTNKCWLPENAHFRKPITNSKMTG